MDWRGKTVVITGGSAGIGFATARAFAARGAKLALLARDLQRLEQARQELQSYSIEVSIHSVDMANSSDVKAAASLIEKNLGPLDLWINNATVSVVGEVTEITDEEFRRVTDVTYLGYVYGTKAALESMKRNGSGKILQVSSGLAYRSIPLQSAYCAAKHAILGFSESLRTELIHNKSPIRLTLVHLPAVNTPQFGWTKNYRKQKFRPMPPVYSADYIAEQIVWAAEHERREIFVGGLTAIGALVQKISPQIVDYYLARTSYRAQLQPGKPNITNSSNLWAPVKGYFGSKGEYLREEKSWSFQFWFARNRFAVLSILGSLIMVLIYARGKLNLQRGGSFHVQ